MTSRIDSLIADIRAAAAGRSKRSLAAEAGLHLNTLKHLRGQQPWRPTVDTLNRLEHVLFPTKTSDNSVNPNHDSTSECAMGRGN
jgi:hypothetical protein